MLDVVYLNLQKLISGGLDEGGDGGDHSGPRAGGGGSGAAGPPSNLRAF